MKHLKIVGATVLVLLICSIAFAATWPTAEITPDPLEFADTHVGATSNTEYFTVTNTDARWPIYIFSVKSSDTSNFNIVSDGCTHTTLIPGRTCEIGLTFKPSAAGHFEASLSVISTDSRIVDTAKMKGLGIAPRVVLSTTSIDFGDQSINKGSQAYEVLLTNSGNEPLTISSITTDAPYSLTDNCSDEVAVDASCNIFITFTPTEVAEFAGQVLITDDAADSPQIISLVGRGIDPGTPDISFSRTSVDFGAQAINLLSIPQTVTVKNSGTAPVVISAITASSNFAMEDTACVKTLAEDETCTLSILFQPSAVEAYSGIITITDNVSGSPQIISLIGRGVQDGSIVIDISTVDIEFGDVNVGETSAPSTVTVRNDGMLPSEIIAVYVDGLQSHSFSKSDNCQGNTLTAGESCLITTTFSPADDGRLTAKLNLLYTSATAPEQVSLVGTGISNSDGGGGCSLMRTKFTR